MFVPKEVLVHCRRESLCVSGFCTRVRFRFSPGLLNLFKTLCRRTSSCPLTKRACYCSAVSLLDWTGLSQTHLSSVTIKQGRNIRFLHASYWRGLLKFPSAYFISISDKDRANRSGKQEILSALNGHPRFNLCPQNIPWET